MLSIKSQIDGCLQTGVCYCHVYDILKTQWHSRQVMACVRGNTPPHENFHDMHVARGSGNSSAHTRQMLRQSLLLPLLLLRLAAAVGCCRPDRHVPHIRCMKMNSDILIFVCVAAVACCRPDRYVPLFGGGAYDIANEREGDMPFDEQLRGLEEVVKAGKVRGRDLA
jgi:hypothetical protein